MRTGIPGFGPTRRCIAAIAALAGGALAQSPEFIPLGYLEGPRPGRWCQPLAVSADGSTVVGYASTDPNGMEGFRWTAAGGIQGLGYYPGGAHYSLAWSVSGDGSVIMGAGDPATGEPLFIWTQATGIQRFTGIAPVPDPWFVPGYFLSGDGSAIAGIVWGNEHHTAFEGVLWTAQSGMQRLGRSEPSTSRGHIGMYTTAISSDGATVVGVGDPEPGPVALGEVAVRWTEAHGFERLGYLGPTASGAGRWSWAVGVSADGSVVVGTSSSDAGSAAFRWSASEGMRALGVPAGATVEKGTLAAGISGDGRVVAATYGVGYGQGYEERAMLWDPVNGPRDLWNVLRDSGLTSHLGWTHNWAVSVSGDGRTILGAGKPPTGEGFQGWLVRLPHECYANCDGSTSAPVLNVSDYVCFLNKFSAGDSYANCDESTTTPLLNVSDFVCFQNQFAAGCP